MNIYNAVGPYGNDKQELSLVEKKKLQWSQEKADQNEWFPFGKKNDYPSRKSSQIVNNNNETTPALENNYTTTVKAKTAIKTTKGQIISPNLLQNQDLGGGALLSQTAAHCALASQPTDKVIHVHIGSSASNAFVPSQPSSSSITTAVPIINLNNATAGLVSSPLVVGEQYQGVVAALNLSHQQQPILVHQMPVARQNVGQMFTNGSYSPAHFYEFKAGYVDSNDSMRIHPSPHEYTEQWANQLNYWQKQQSPDEKAANLIIDNFNQKILSKREENRLIAAACQSPSTFVCSTPVQQQNFHQPSIPYTLNQPLPMAYVSPLIYNSETQRTAPVISPLASKPPSINDQDFVDPVYQGFNCFSPLKVSGLDDGLNYSNNAIKINGEELTAEQKQKIMENKVAIEKQIMEKQRLKAMETERERIDNERFEKERQLLELKEKLENQKELTRWKELQREEELREASVKEALEKARLEAQLHRKQKLYKHANSSRSIDNSDYSINNNDLALITSTNSSGVLSDSAISVPFLNSSNLMNSTSDFDRASENLITTTRNLSDLKSPTNFVNNSYDYSVSQPSATTTNDSRSQSLPPHQNNEHFWRSSNTNNAQSCNATSTTSNVRYVADERPIKPMDENAYNEWQTLTAEIALDDNCSKASATINRSKVNKKIVSKEAVRKSRSVAAPKAVNGRRSESLDNRNPSKQPVKQLQDSKTAADKAVKAEKVVTVESRLPSAATYIISREYIFDQKEQPNEKTIESTKAPSPRRNVSIAEPLTSGKLVKSKSESAFKTLLTKKANVGVPPDKQSTPKTGGSNGSRAIAAPDLINKDDISNSNPWGDQFGGLNPLLHRLSTRKKVRQAQLQQHLDASFNLSSQSQPTKILSKTPPSGTASRQKEPTVKAVNNGNTTPKLPNRTSEKCAQPSKEDKKSEQLQSDYSCNNNNNISNPLLQKVTTRKKLAANSTQDVKFFSDELQNNKSAIALAKNAVNEGIAKDDNSLLFSKNDVNGIYGSENFSKKNTTYRSFAVRSKQASEKQSDMLKQLSSLKEQLKMSQRVVENTMRTKSLLSKPDADVVHNTRLCKQV